MTVPQGLLLDQLLAPDFTYVDKSSLASHDPPLVSALTSGCYSLAQPSHTALSSSQVVRRASLLSSLQVVL